MPKTGIEFNGEVVEKLPNAFFRIELENGQSILGRLGGKMRVHYIRVTPGDWVTVEMSPYDLTKGRIVRRLGEFDARRLAAAKKESNNNQEQ